MAGRKDLPQTRIRLTLEALEDRLAAGNLLPFLSLTPPHMDKRSVACVPRRLIN